MAVYRVGYKILEEWGTWAYLMYYVDTLEEQNRSYIRYRVICGNHGSNINIPDGARCGINIYRSGVLDYIDNTHRYIEIAEGERENFEEEADEEILEEEVDEEILEEEVPFGMMSAEGYFSEIQQIMKNNGDAFYGGSIIAEDFHYIENDWFNGKSVDVKIEVDTDVYDELGIKLTGSASFRTRSTMSWTKDASSIYPAAYSAQMGKTLNLSIVSTQSSYKHELYYTFGDRTYPYRFAVNVYDSIYSWSIPDIASLCNNTTSGNLKIICKTYLGYSYRGANETNITLSVPDPTEPTITSKIMLGTAYAISCKRNSSNFTNRLEFVFKDKTVSIAEGKVDSRSWTPSYDLAKQIPTLVSTGGTLKCTTLNGTAVVGTKTVSITMTVPDNDTTKPSFSSSDLTLEPIGDLGSAFAELFIRSKTGLKVTMSATSEYSTISEYSVTAGSVSVKGNPGTIDLLVDEGDVTVTAKVTDARGFSKTVTKIIYVYPYRRPKVVPHTGYRNIICERANSSGELSPSGTYLAIKAGKSYSAISPSGMNLNPCILRYRWKTTSTEDFGPWSTLLANDSSALEKSLLISGIVSSLSTSYEVEIQAYDALGGEHTLTFTIMTEAISFVLYDGVDGAGFGKYPEEPHVVDIASHMTLRVRGKLVVDGGGWESLGLASGINESVYGYGRNAVAACSYLVSNGNHVHVAFNCAFSYAGSAKVVNGNVIPESYRPVGTVYALCPINDRGIALVSVSSDGYIRVEWVQKLTDTVQTGSASVIWIDGYLDYWT